MSARALQLGPGGSRLPGHRALAAGLASAAGPGVGDGALEGLNLVEEQRDGPERDAFAALERGDHEAALTVLMDAYGDAVYRFCRQLVRDPELAADVQQMTFVAAYRSLGRFRGKSKWKTWLFGIARHRALDAIKMRRRRRQRFVQVEELPEPGEADGGGTEVRAESRSLKSALADCLAKLAPRIRTAVLLRYQNEMSYRDMAEACGEQAATLQARVSRAMPVLKRCLRAQGVTP